MHADPDDLGEGGHERSRTTGMLVQGLVVGLLGFSHLCRLEFLHPTIELPIL